MNILIVSATELEIADSVPTFNHYRIDHLVTGVGMVATAYALGKRLQERSYDLLVNVGIAGSFNPEHELGTVLKIKSDRIFHFGAEQGSSFLPIEQMGFGESSFSEILPTEDLVAAYHNLPYADAISVNMVHGAAETIQRLQTELPKNCLESMEGAAFFYAAQEAGVPCIQVRAVSNLVEERNTANWNIPKALQSLNDWLQNFLNHQKRESDF